MQFLVSEKHLCLHHEKSQPEPAAGKKALKLNWITSCLESCTGSNCCFENCQDENVEPWLQIQHESVLLLTKRD